jgi:hypothetical protein
MLPKNIDVEAVYRAVFRGSPDQMFDELLAACRTKLGDEAATEAISEFEAIFELAQDEPGQVFDPMIALFESVAAGLGDDFVERLLPQITSTLRASLFDFSPLMAVVNARQFVRENKDDRGYGRAYAFFRQAFEMHPRAMQVGVERRRQLEGDVEGPRNALEDYQLLVDYFRTLDGDVTTYWTQRLADLWWRVYERPVFRVCLILWYFGQELRNPGNSLQAPTTSVGALFEQARDFTQAAGLQFPFRPNLNKLRNAIHQRQTKIGLDLGVALYDKHGQMIERLEFEQLLNSVREDIEFCVHADIAAQHAFLACLDEHGVFDAMWARLMSTLAAQGIKEADLLVSG